MASKDKIFPQRRKEKMKHSADNVTETKTLNRLPGEDLGMILGIEGGRQGSKIEKIFVKSVSVGGAASRATGGSMGICEGDNIIEVNGTNLLQYTHDECIDILRDLPLQVNLKISRQYVSSETLPAVYLPHHEAALIDSCTESESDGMTETETFGEKLPEGFTLVEVVLKKKEGESLGISIVPSYGITKDFYQIKRLLPKGVCERSGLLNIGDCLVICNSTSLKYLTQPECLKILKTAGNNIHLHVLRATSSFEFDTLQQYAVSPTQSRKSNEQVENLQNSDLNTVPSEMEYIHDGVTKNSEMVILSQPFQPDVIDSDCYDDFFPSHQLELRAGTQYDSTMSNSLHDASLSPLVDKSLCEQNEIEMDQIYIPPPLEFTDPTPDQSDGLDTSKEVTNIDDIVINLTSVRGRDIDTSLPPSSDHIYSQPVLAAQYQHQDKQTEDLIDISSSPLTNSSMSSQHNTSLSGTANLSSSGELMDSTNIDDLIHNYAAALADAEREAEFHDGSSEDVNDTNHLNMMNSLPDEQRTNIDHFIADYGLDKISREKGEGVTEVRDSQNVSLIGHEQRATDIDQLIAEFELDKHPPLQKGNNIENQHLAYQKNIDTTNSVQKTNIDDLLDIFAVDEKTQTGDMNHENEKSHSIPVNTDGVYSMKTTVGTPRSTDNGLHTTDIDDLISGYTFNAKSEKHGGEMVEDDKIPIHPTEAISPTNIDTAINDFTLEYHQLEQHTTDFNNSLKDHHEIGTFDIQRTTDNETDEYTMNEQDNNSISDNSTKTVSITNNLEGIPIEFISQHDSHCLKDKKYDEEINTICDNAETQQDVVHLEIGKPDDSLLTNADTVEKSSDFSDLHHVPAVVSDVMEECVNSSQHMLPMCNVENNPTETADKSTSKNDTDKVVPFQVKRIGAGFLNSSVVPLFETPSASETENESDSSVTSLTILQQVLQAWPSVEGKKKERKSMGNLSDVQEHEIVAQTAKRSSHGLKITQGPNPPKRPKPSTEQQTVLEKPSQLEQRNLFDSLSEGYSEMSSTDESDHQEKLVHTLKTKSSSPLLSDYKKDVINAKHDGSDVKVNNISMVELQNSHLSESVPMSDSSLTSSFIEISSSVDDIHENEIKATVEKPDSLDTVSTSSQPSSDSIEPHKNKPDSEQLINVKHNGSDVKVNNISMVELQNSHLSESVPMSDSSLTSSSIEISSSVDDIHENEIKATVEKSDLLDTVSTSSQPSSDSTEPHKNKPDSEHNVARKRVEWHPADNIKTSGPIDTTVRNYVEDSVNKIDKSDVLHPCAIDILNYQEVNPNVPQANKIEEKKMEVPRVVNISRENNLSSSDTDKQCNTKNILNENQLGEKILNVEPEELNKNASKHQKESDKKDPIPARRIKLPTSLSLDSKHNDESPQNTDSDSQEPAAHAALSRKSSSPIEKAMSQFKPVSFVPKFGLLSRPVKYGSSGSSRSSSNASTPSSTSPVSLKKSPGYSSSEHSDSSGNFSSPTKFPKTRTDNEPFQVDVFKGILGLGMKVTVVSEGVCITEINKNSPIAKNGNLRVGDYVVSVNNTMMDGLTESKVQQFLRLLPRGLIKIVATTSKPQQNTPDTSIAPEMPEQVKKYDAASSSEEIMSLMDTKIVSSHSKLQDDAFLGNIDSTNICSMADAHKHLEHTPQKVIHDGVPISSEISVDKEIARDEVTSSITSNDDNNSLDSLSLSSLHSTDSTIPTQGVTKEDKQLTLSSSELSAISSYDPESSDSETLNISQAETLPIPSHVTVDLQPSNTENQVNKEHLSNTDETAVVDNFKKTPVISHSSTELVLSNVGIDSDSSMIENSFLDEHTLKDVDSNFTKSNSMIQQASPPEKPDINNLAELNIAPVPKPRSKPKSNKESSKDVNSEVVSPSQSSPYVTLSGGSNISTISVKDNLPLQTNDLPINNYRQDERDHIHQHIVPTTLDDPVQFFEEKIEESSQMPKNNLSKVSISHSSLGMGNGGVPPDHMSMQKGYLLDASSPMTFDAKVHESVDSSDKFPQNISNKLDNMRNEDHMMSELSTSHEVTVNSVVEEKSPKLSDQPLPDLNSAEFGNGFSITPSKPHKTFQHKTIIVTSYNPDRSDILSDSDNLEESAFSVEKKSDLSSDTLSQEVIPTEQEKDIINMLPELNHDQESYSHEIHNMKENVNEEKLAKYIVKNCIDSVLGGSVPYMTSDTSKSVESDSGLDLSQSLEDNISSGSSDKYDDSHDRLSSLADFTDTSPDEALSQNIPIDKPPHSSQTLTLGFSKNVVSISPADESCDRENMPAGKTKTVIKVQHDTPLCSQPPPLPPAPPPPMVQEMDCKDITPSKYVNTISSTQQNKTKEIPDGIPVPSPRTKQSLQPAELTSPATKPVQQSMEITSHGSKQPSESVEIVPSSAKALSQPADTMSACISSSFGPDNSGTKISLNPPSQTTSYKTKNNTNLFSDDLSKKSQNEKANLFPNAKKSIVDVSNLSDDEKRIHAVKDNTHGHKTTISIGLQESKNTSADIKICVPSDNLEDCKSRESNGLSHIKAVGTEVDDTMRVPVTSINGTNNSQFEHSLHRDETSTDVKVNNACVALDTDTTVNASSPDYEVLLTPSHNVSDDNVIDVDNGMFQIEKRLDKPSDSSIKHEDRDFLQNTDSFSNKNEILKPCVSEDVSQIEIESSGDIKTESNYSALLDLYDPFTALSGLSDMKSNSVSNGKHNIDKTNEMFDLPDNSLEHVVPDGTTCSTDTSSKLHTNDLLSAESNKLLEQEPLGLEFSVSSSKNDLVFPASSGSGWLSEITTEKSNLSIQRDEENTQFDNFVTSQLDCELLMEDSKNTLSISDSQKEDRSNLNSDILAQTDDTELTIHPDVEKIDTTLCNNSSIFSNDEAYHEREIVCPDTVHVKKDIILTDIVNIEKDSQNLKSNLESKPPVIDNKTLLDDLSVNECVNSVTDTTTDIVSPVQSDAEKKFLKLENEIAAPDREDQSGAICEKDSNVMVSETPGDTISPTIAVVKNSLSDTSHHTALVTESKLLSDDTSINESDLIVQKISADVISLNEPDAKKEVLNLEKIPDSKASVIDNKTVLGTLPEKDGDMFISPSANTPTADTVLCRRDWCLTFYSDGASQTMYGDCNTSLSTVDLSHLPTLSPGKLTDILFASNQFMDETGLSNDLKICIYLVEKAEVVFLHYGLTKTMNYIQISSHLRDEQDSLGLHAGDCVVSVNGRSTATFDSESDFMTYLHDQKTGSIVVLACSIFPQSCKDKGTPTDQSVDVCLPTHHKEQPEELDTTNVKQASKVEVVSKECKVGEDEIVAATKLTSDEETPTASSNMNELPTDTRSEKSEQAEIQQPAEQLTSPIADTVASGSSGADASETPKEEGIILDVVMNKGATGLGFCIEGGIASPKGDVPIIIKRIFKSAGDRCSQLRAKDEILRVNKVDVTDMRQYEAWNLLKFLPEGKVKLKLRRYED